MIGGDELRKQLAEGLDPVIDSIIPNNHGRDLRKTPADAYGYQLDIYKVEDYYMGRTGEKINNEKTPQGEFLFDNDENITKPLTRFRTSLFENEDITKPLTRFKTSLFKNEDVDKSLEGEEVFLNLYVNKPLTGEVYENEYIENSLNGEELYENVEYENSLNGEEVYENIEDENLLNNEFVYENIEYVYNQL